jgi:hypothetical protein
MSEEPPMTETNSQNNLNFQHMEKIQFTNNLFFRQASPLVTLSVDYNNRVNYDLNLETLKYLRANPRSRLITIGGPCSNDIKTFTNTLPLILNRIVYKDELADLFSEINSNENQKVFSIIMEEIRFRDPSKLNKSGVVDPLNDNVKDILEEVPTFIVKLECLDTSKLNLKKNKEDLLSRCIDKLYILFYLISDAFIILLDPKKEDESRDIMKKLSHMCKFVQKKKSGKFNIENVQSDHLFIFLKNTPKIEPQMLNNLLVGINKNKNYEDWIFPISEVPEDFYTKPLAIYVKDSDYEADIITAFNSIANTVRNNFLANDQKFNFHVDRLSMYIQIFKEEKKDVFGDIIELETHMDEIEKRIEIRLKVLEKHSLILNSYNYFFYRNEIVEEVVQNYVREQMKKDRIIKRIKTKVLEQDNNGNRNNGNGYSLLKKEKVDIEEILNEEEDEDFPQIKSKPIHIEKGNVFETGAETVDPIQALRDISAEKGKSMTIDETINDILNFHNKKVSATQDVIKSDGTKGKMINLDDGDSYLIYKSNNGEVTALDAFGMSEDWTASSGDISKTEKVSIPETKTKVNDYLKNMKDYESAGKASTPSTSEAMASKVSNEELAIQGNALAKEFGLSAAGVSSAIIGTIIANWINGQYKDVPWGQILKRDLIITGGLSVAVTGVTVKMPWIGFAVIGSLFGLESFNTLSEKSLDNPTKRQMLAKNSSEIAVAIGFGAGFTYLGTVLGSFVPGIGNAVGSLVGMMVGSLFGGFSGTYISSKIEKQWKIVDPKEILNMLQDKMNKIGYWEDYKYLLEKMKFNYDFVMSKIPKDFDEKKFKFATKEIIWSNFIFLNVLTFIAATNPNLQEQCRIVFEKPYRFLKHEKDYISIKYFYYLDELKDVIENWIGLLS